MCYNLYGDDMNKKVKYSLIYIISIILSISAGSLATIFALDHFEVINVDKVINNSEKVETVSKNISITEDNSIKESIDKIYNAVVVVEVYNKNNVKIGSGSGFVYKNTDFGYIITNYHVIEEATSVKVTDASGNVIDAKVLGSDEYSDIAVLSIPSNAVLQVAEIGDSTKLSLGDTLFTVGSPLGSKYSGTVTKGILSGINRQVTVSLTNGNFVMEVLQTDAAINPGNRGGPLLNINGEVIGVTSMKLVQDEIEGMGFAIPIELVMTTVQKLEKGEKIERPLLGVSLIDISNPYILRRYNISVGSVTSGVAVVSVQNGSPASTGLKQGDIITAINGEKTEDTAHFNYILYKYAVGDTIKVTYIRDGKENTADIVLSKSLTN